ncbi:MAG TPA: sugar ABC transporter permease [Streptosporangiaceae bacterium]|nr:sugar ABC transporter permease [Streptosporangiaceae bacterium]
MSSARRGRLLPYILLSPLVVFIGALSFVPTADTTVEAFFRVMPLNPPTQFTGLGNFRALFANPAITTSWVNTAVYVVVGVVLSVILGTAMALALRQKFRFRGIVLALVILPWALPAVVEAVIWNWIYNPTFGVMNSALHSAHLIGGYHVWLGLDRWLTVVLIEIVQVWQITPLSAVVILAALQSISPDLYEAARVDGAGPVQSFVRISLPLIRPALAVCTVEALVLSLNIFDQVYILNGIAPLGSSVMLQTYVQTFEDLNFGSGYALSLLITLATALLSLAALALFYRRSEATS